MTSWTVTKALLLKDLVDFGIFVAIIAVVVIVALVAARKKNTK